MKLQPNQIGSIMKKTPDIIIIGGGPAGISAAIQLKRFDLSPILFEKNSLGGLLQNAHSVENYPGFPDGISGVSLVSLLKKHLKHSFLDAIYETVVLADYDSKINRFLLETNKRSYTADIIIDASGTKPKTEAITNAMPHLSPPMNDWITPHIYYDVVSLRESKNKHAVIIGAGDIAFDYSLNLSENEGNQITIAYRGNTIKALPLLHRRVLEKSNIKLMNYSVLKKIETGSKFPLKLTLSKQAEAPSKETTRIGAYSSDVIIEADALIGATGREPQNEFYSGRLLEKKDLLTAENRLFVIGDAKNGLARQAAIAAGNGIECAMKIGTMSEPFCISDLLGKG